MQEVILMHKKNFIPKVIVAGDVETFKSLNGNRPVQIIGEISFAGKLNEIEYNLLTDKRVCFNGQIVNFSEIETSGAKGTFDYIVFLNYEDFLLNIRVIDFAVLSGNRAVTIDFYLNFVNNVFFSAKNELTIFDIIANEKINSLLDFDAFFLNGQIHSKSVLAPNTKMECVDEERRAVYPLFNNIYDRIYHSIDECKYRHYNAILLTADRDNDNFAAAIRELSNMTEQFIIFVRQELQPINISDDIVYQFKPIKNFKIANGTLIIMKKDAAEDLKIYVVTHKKCELPKLPNNYEIIQVGRALNQDLGYKFNDSTGENISTLNPYINENTAIYWIWRNTASDFVGISHYRRFFSNKNSEKYAPKNIVTGEQVKKFLQDYDMIVGDEFNSYCSNNSLLVAYLGAELYEIYMKLMRFVFNKIHPEYLETFDYIMSSSSLYRCNMFITRKYIYDDYCEWLFPILISATNFINEFNEKHDIKPNSQQNRFVGFIAERLLSVWLMKNNLRLKELYIMKVE